MTRLRIKTLGAVVLLILLVLQGLWVHSSYRTSKSNYLQAVDQCLVRAADAELGLRLYSIRWYTEPDNLTDTVTYVTKPIITMDTTFQVRVNQKDPTTMPRVKQFLLKGFCPLNPANVDSLFKEYMMVYSFKVEESYIEYLDLKKNWVISHNALAENHPGYLESKVLPLDIINTIGVKAYTKAPFWMLMNPYLFNIILSSLLMFTVLVVFFKLLGSMLQQRKEGFRVLRNMSSWINRYLSRHTEQVNNTVEDLKKNALMRKARSLERVCANSIEPIESAKKLRRYVDNEEGKIEFKMTQVSLRPILIKLEEQFEKTKHKTVQVEVICNEYLKLKTDAYYFSQVLEELLTNSTRFSNDPVRITIMAEQVDRQVFIRILDDGWGIPRDECESVLKVNSKVLLHERRLNGKGGLGVGLCFVDSFARSLGGSITMDSNEGRFTYVMLIFPAFHENIIRCYKKGGIKNVISEYRNRLDPFRFN